MRKAEALKRRPVSSSGTAWIGGEGSKQQTEVLGSLRRGFSSPHAVPLEAQSGER